MEIGEDISIVRLKLATPHTSAQAMTEAHFSLECRICG